MQFDFFLLLGVEGRPLQTEEMMHMKDIKALGGGVLHIGRTGEHEAVRVVFSLLPFKAAFSGGTPALLVRRAGDDAAYPVPLTVDGDAAYWTVTCADTEKAGFGQCELQWYAGKTLAKSAKFDFLVAQALDGGAEPPDAPSKRWFEDLEGKIGDLSKLGTKEKENLVAAINEAARSGGMGGGRTDMQVADGYIRYCADGQTWENLIALAELKGADGRDGAKERIFCTTDREKGTLKALADREGYETFVVPDDIGGRFSVLTPVGLLPIAAAGIDVEELLSGAADGMTEYLVPEFEHNSAMQYAAARNVLYEQGNALELLVSYDPDFLQMAEWWKQLFGESEGKDHKGLFPCAAIFSTDLHSLGQFVQDGSRTLFETVVRFKKAKHGFAVANDSENADGLNFLSGMDMAEINEKARLGTLIAHTEGGVPNIIITSEAKKPYEVGKLIYFFEIAVAISGYMLGVNPFDQPGVESYKKNMFALLGKPGYEDMKAALEAKI